MPDHEQYLLLIVHVLDLLETNHLGNGQRLERQVLFGLTMSHQKHTTECAGAYVHRQVEEDISREQTGCRQWRHRLLTRMDKVQGPTSYRSPQACVKNFTLVHCTQNSQLRH